MPVKEYTAESFSKEIGCEKQDGYGLLRYLVQAGLAENLGSRPNPGVKGKQPTIYSIKADAGKKMAEKLNKLA